MNQLLEGIGIWDGETDPLRLEVCVQNMIQTCEFMVTWLPVFHCQPHTSLLHQGLIHLNNKKLVLKGTTSGVGFF